MHEFRVWAPERRNVAVQIGETQLPMNGPDGRGWWSVQAEAKPGDDYGFLLEEEEQAYPDPRSLWQPHGVHGLSRVYDENAFQWTDHGWGGVPLSSAILYELHIGTFTREGTFDAAIARLDYLVELGVTHVELMPVNEFPGDRGWGYDGVQLFAVTRNYGGPDGLKRFVNACHEKGLAVVLDVVYNHFGPTGNYTPKFGPYLTETHHTPWGGAVNLDESGSDEVRRFFCDNALMWLRDYHMDGLRLDAVHELNDRSAVHFLEQLSAEVETLSAMVGRKLVLIAECDLNDPKFVRGREAHGFGMDAQWTDDFHHSLFTLLSQDHEGRGYYDDYRAFENLPKALKNIFVFDGQYSQYRGHSHGRPVEGLSAHHFIGFIQNHDQVGNRATGDRLEHLVGCDAAKAALGLVLTAPFVPMLFMGEEFAATTPFLYFADHEDEEMARMVFEGRKREFGDFGFDSENEVPNPVDRETFERSKLNWDEIGQGQHKALLEWTRKLIKLRRSSMSLNNGDMSHLKVHCSDCGWLTMERGKVIVMLNVGCDEFVADVPEGYRLAVATPDSVAVQDGKVVLPKVGFAVLSSEAEAQ